ncbi:hydrogenase expression/formation protein [Ectothiorhodospiraceae bacterium BW-2]|nr:hydrogenase expression/formation protein [Ectothiorhodospiraceae bacterium BW-2]
MSSLDAITIEQEPWPEFELGHNAEAILMELTERQQHYLSHGESGAIDLRTLPLSIAEREKLRYILGHGEVTITLNSCGRSDIYETAIAGIWWLSHYNEEGELLAEQLEVTPLPAIVATDRSEIALAQQLLRQRIKTELPQAADEGVNDETDC